MKTIAEWKRCFPSTDQKATRMRTLTKPMMMMMMMFVMTMMMMATMMVMMMVKLFIVREVDGETLT